MMNQLLADAERVAKGASAPSFTKADYEDEMLKIAEKSRLDGESPAVAFSRLIGDRDPRLMSLYKAARRAAEEQPATREDIAKALSSKEWIFGLMEKIVAHEKRADETHAAAFNRLVREDKELRAAYEMYRALG